MLRPLNCKVSDNKRLILKKWKVTILKRFLCGSLLICIFGMLCFGISAYAQSVDYFSLQDPHPGVYDANTGLTYHFMSTDPVQTHQKEYTLRLDVSDVPQGKHVWVDAVIGTKNRASISGVTITPNFFYKQSGPHFTQQSGIHDDIKFRPNYIRELSSGNENGNIRFFGINLEPSATGFLRANINNDPGVHDKMIFDVHVVSNCELQAAEVVNASYNNETGIVHIDSWALSYYGANGFVLYLIPEYIDPYNPQIQGNQALFQENVNKITSFDLWESAIAKNDLEWGYDYAVGDLGSSVKIYHPNVDDITKRYPPLNKEKRFYDCYKSHDFFADDNTGRYNGQFYIAIQGYYLNGNNYWGVSRPVVLADALIPVLTIHEKSNEALSEPNTAGTVYRGTEGLLTCEVSHYISHSATGVDVPGTLTYQWYTKEADGTYTEIEGATESSFSVPETLALGSYTYACKVINTITITGETRIANVNEQNITVTDTEEAMQEFTVNVVRKPVPYPTAKDYIYNGELRIGITPESFEGMVYNAEGITRAVLPGTYAATAKLVSDHYCWADGSLEDYPLTWKISPVSGLDVVYVSPFTNTATPEAMKLAIHSTAHNAGITLPDNFIASYTGGNGIATDSGGYDVSGNAVWKDLLGKVDDKMDMVLSVDGIACVTGTFTVTTGQDYVFGNNTSEWENPLSIIKHETPSAWTEKSTDAYIKAKEPEIVVVRAYLRPNQKMLVDTEIGIYHGRVDVTVKKESDGTVQATDHIDGFFPVTTDDDYFISKLPESGTTQQGDSAYADINNKNTLRDDYWYNVEPFVATEEGIYRITFCITGESYLLDYSYGLGAQYGKDPGNDPANAPQTTFKKISIQPKEAKEQYGIDA